MKVQFSMEITIEKEVTEDPEFEEIALVKQLEARLDGFGRMTFSKVGEVTCSGWDEVD